MNVVDSSGWIEWVTNGPNAGHFEAPLEASDRLVVPALSIFEVYRFLLRKRDRETALIVAAAMRQGRVVELTGALAVEAAEVASMHGLPMADAIIYATAQIAGATLWTQDRDFEGLEGVRLFEG